MRSNSHQYKRILFTVSVVSLVAAFWLPCAFAVEEPDGYRLELYDDVVPATLQGATRVTALEVVRLRSEFDALVVDVIPEHIKPDTLPAGQRWFPVVHRGVANALWLPDVGYGSLSRATENYFKRHLQISTNGDLDHPVVFYCRIDCWMSWNAAKRALSFGYTRVSWFADGIDDWRFEGLETQVLQPAPGVRH
ncbi:MAG: rhodanese-like domain-containing protein [Granulosicoccus sp.]